MILELPDGLSNVVGPNSYAEALSICHGILLILLQKWHIPGANSTFTASRKDKTACLCIIRNIWTSDRKDGSSVTSEGGKRLEELVSVLVIFLDIFYIPQFDLAVFGGCCEDLKALRVVHTSYGVKMCSHIILSLNELRSNALHVTFRFLFIFFQYAGLSINNFHILIDIISLIFGLRDLLLLLLILLFGQHLFLQLLGITETTSVDFTLEVFFHFFLGFIVEGLDFIDFIYVENIIVANLLKELQE